MFDVHVASLLIWGVLYVLAAIAAHALVERTIFHATHRLVHPVGLQHLLRDWLQHRQIGFSKLEYSLGWLGPLVYESQSAPRSDERLWELSCRQRDSILRFQNVLPTVANVATATGLLAGVLALVSSAGSDGVEAIGLGMYGTMVGLLIAIPVTLFLGLTHGRTDKLATQTDEVINVLEQMMRERTASLNDPSANTITPTTSALPIAPVANEPPVVAPEPAKPERRRSRAKPSAVVSPVPAHIPVAPLEPPISMASQRGDRLVDGRRMPDSPDTDGEDS